MWQPIETAPTGQRIRLGSYYQKPTGELIWFTEVGMAFEWADGTFPWSGKKRMATYEGNKSTHWQPLPAPPEPELVGVVDLRRV